MKTKYRILEKYGEFTPQKKRWWFPFWDNYADSYGGSKIKFNNLLDAMKWLAKTWGIEGKPANRKIHEVIGPPPY